VGIKKLMKNKQFKNIKFRNELARFEINKKINKFIFINLLRTGFKINKRVYSYFLNKLNKKNDLISKSKIKSVCVLTSRNNSVEKKMSISRIKLREMFSFGIIPGYKKAVW
jgi:ribosomal protein S14